MVLGDSVRGGYYPLVYGLLNRPGIRFVDPPGELWDTRAAVRGMEGWLAQSDHFDVIHFNFGLHDIRRYTPDTTGVPIDEYAANLERIARRFQATGARLFFATTTPVVPPTNFGRRPEDVIAYNAVAREIMDRLRIPVNDLWQIGQANLTNSVDGTHFSQSVNRLMGEQVLRYITDVPRIEPSPDGSGVWVDSWPACLFRVETSLDMKSWIPSKLQIPDALYHEFWPRLPGERSFIRVRVVIPPGQ